MLNGWKAIAAYLGREERTAMRWAAERGLPVRRLPGPGRGSVYALPEEIDAWRAPEREAAQAQSGRSSEKSRIGIARPHARALLLISGALALGIVALILIRLWVVPRRQPQLADEAVFTDPAAKALFLQANYDWNLRTHDSLVRATQEYSAAIGRDPRVAASYVGLANSYLLLREDGAMSDAAAYSRADAAVQAAVALAPQSFEAHRAIAFIDFWWHQDRGAAGREFARAIALKPDDALTHHWFATALVANDEAAAALREIEIARDLDPTATALIADRGLILYMSGSQAAGLSALRTLAQEQPQAVSPHRYLGSIALFEGRGSEFLREYQIAARLRGDASGLAAVQRWQAMGSDAGTIDRAMLADELRTVAYKQGSWFRVAQIDALSGHRDDAIKALSRACAARDPASVSAIGDLWLRRALSHAMIEAQCGPARRMS